LAAASDPDTFVQVVATTLGVQQRPTMSLEGSILESLRAKELLIVLDNCEHLLEEASRLAEGILQACPKVRILATSREGLALEGEQVWPLRSLQLATSASTSAIAASSAGRLFEERAQAVAPGFTIDAQSGPAVAEICRRLDGIPLAIELAAARVASMSPSEIAALLDERFRLLTGGRRTAVERHSTLRATVEWSYALLEPSEREVFDRLGAFSGSFDGTAASAVVAGEGIDQWDVRDAMANLVAKSMVNAEKTADDTTRYSMLEALRQYARERLDETGVSDLWRRRHAAHYAVFAEAIAPELTGPEELTARRRLAFELDNVRAAVTWALDSPAEADAELGVGIIAHLEFETVTSMSSGVGAWALRAVPRVDASAPARRQAVLGAAAYHVQVSLGDFEHARELALAGIAEGVTELGGRVSTLAYITLAQNYMATGDIDRTRGVIDECLRGADALIDDPGFTRSSVLAASAAMLMSMGATDDAKVDADAAMVDAQRCQTPTCLTLSYFAVGWAWIADDPDRALAALDESIALTRAGANDGAYGAALSEAAALRARRGERLEAIEDLREAIAHRHEVGDLLNLTVALRRASGIVGELGYTHLAAVFTGIATGHHLNEMMKAMTLPGEELAFNRSVDVRVRAELGPAAYEAATARGAALTTSEIVDCTLDELDRIRAQLETD
jgi:predicted ATPase